MNFSGTTRARTHLSFTLILGPPRRAKNGLGKVGRLFFVLTGAMEGREGSSSAPTADLDGLWTVGKSGGNRAPER